MGLITKEVEVTLNSANMQHFINKRYELPTHLNKKGKPIIVGSKMMVSVEDLNHGSNFIVDVECDMCHDEILHVPYNNYISRMKKNGQCLCTNCGYIQAKLTNVERYGVDSYAKTQECQDKKRNTCIKKYGVPVSSQADCVKEKCRKTCMGKYGVEHPWKDIDIKAKVDSTIKKRYGVDNISQSDEVKVRKAQTNFKNTGFAYNLQNPKILEKAKHSIKDKFGTEYPMQSPLFKERMIEIYGESNPNLIPEIKDKIQTTNLEKYGGITPVSSKEIQEKIRNSMYKNGTVPTSSQQKAIYDIYKSHYSQAQLNYPIGKKFSGDIIIDNIDIEIDYGGHNLNVKKGTITQEEFNQKELIRDKIVKSEDYKIIRLITNKERGIPSDQKLLEILEISKNYFNTTEHTWINWNIDESKYFNAEHQDGVLFDFGELHKLPKNIKSA